MPSLTTNRREMLLTLAALLTAAFCVYANSIGNSWVYDDFPIIVSNPDIRSLSAFFDNAYPGRPLREVTYLLDFALFGLKPACWHIQNILWHGLNAFLVFLLALRLGGARAVAWAASLLFLVHPLQVEAVAGIANRKESLALAFSLLSFLAYAEAFAPGRRKSLWVATSVALGALAFLAKEIAVALPATFFAYELAFVPREQRLLARYWRAWGAALTVGIAAFVAWYFFYGGRMLFLRESVQRLQRFDYTFLAPSELAHIAMVLKSLAFMFLKFLLPLNLAADYAYPLPASWLDPWVLSGLLGLLLYGLALWFSLRRMPPVFFALVWVGAFWLPVSNLWPLGYFAADRYLYTPAAGFFIALAFVLVRAFRRPAYIAALVSVIILPLAFLTWQQNKVWRSEEALWTQAVKVSPRSSHALGFLGMISMDKGEVAKAFELHSKALAMNPKNALSHYDLARIYEMRGNTTPALEHYRRFVALDNPRYRNEAQEVKKHLMQRYGLRTE